ncbi:MAG TPA: DUF29 domain-containing protein [Cyanobacteria bacterium UBA11370]|nr:DUF29 domain-containing protein [Cyanobacteria bacterium UBA11370]HBY76954.1 DUF29 domain-containing protein [Cyanobacteria bacterium UBA11148]
MNSTLYEKDYYLWLENTASLLRDGQLHKLDIPNLIAEIEDMGRRETRTVYSNLKILLMHLLKYRYQPEKRSNSWRTTIEEHRQRIQEAFEDSPSLKNYFTEQWTVGKCYQDAKRLAAKETGLALDAFPSESPFTPEDTLNPDYLPE